MEWWGLLGATALLLLAVIDDVVRPMRSRKKRITLARRRGLARLGTAFRGASLVGRVRSVFVVGGVAANGFVVCLSL